MDLKEESMLFVRTQTDNGLKKIHEMHIFSFFSPVKQLVSIYLLFTKCNLFFNFISFI